MLEIVWQHFEGVQCRRLVGCQNTLRRMGSPKIGRTGPREGAENPEKQVKNGLF